MAECSIENARDINSISPAHFRKVPEGDALSRCSYPQSNTDTVPGQDSKQKMADGPGGSHCCVPANQRPKYRMKKKKQSTNPTDRIVFSFTVSLTLSGIYISLQRRVSVCSFRLHTPSLAPVCVRYETVWSKQIKPPDKKVTLRGQPQKLNAPTILLISREPERAIESESERIKE